MIARLWHGWTSVENADRYQALLENEILPGIRRIAGYRGANLFRREAGDSEVEFVTITYFENLDAIHAFAGDDGEACVVPPPARALLARFDERAVHYAAVWKFEDR